MRPRNEHDAFLTFGEHLARLLANRQRSQQSLAHDCGYDHSYISRLVSGRRSSPSAETIMCICDALDCTASERGHLLYTAGFVPDHALTSLVIALRIMARDAGLDATDTQRVLDDTLVALGLPWEERRQYTATGRSEGVVDA